MVASLQDHQSESCCTALLLRFMVGFIKLTMASPPKRGATQKKVRDAARRTSWPAWPAGHGRNLGKWMEIAHGSSWGMVINAFIGILMVACITIPPQQFLGWPQDCGYIRMRTSKQIVRRKYEFQSLLLKYLDSQFAQLIF